MEVPPELVAEELPVTRVELAVLHKSCTPPDKRRYKPNAINAMKAVARQYSANPCPWSSRKKAHRMTRFIGVFRVTPEQGVIPSCLLLMGGSEWGEGWPPSGR